MSECVGRMSGGTLTSTYTGVDATVDDTREKRSDDELEDQSVSVVQK